jgi:predicted nucleotidyltransferase
MRVRTREEILEALKAELPSLWREHAVHRIAVFGSYARGEQDEASDLDLLVEFSGPVDLLEFIGLELHLTDLLGVKVDLVTPDALRPLMRDSVLGSAVYA